jgi:hypothetical protein
LEEELQQSKQASEELSNFLLEIQSSWQLYYSKTIKDLNESIEEIDVAAMLTMIEQETSDL